MTLKSKSFFPAGRCWDQFHGGSSFYLCSCDPQGRRTWGLAETGDLCSLSIVLGRKNKNEVMKSTHGKCFIISSSSPTEIWHCSVVRKYVSLPSNPQYFPPPLGYIRPTLCHFLSGHSRGTFSPHFLLSYWSSHYCRERPQLPGNICLAIGGSGQVVLAIWGQGAPKTI